MTLKILLQYLLEVTRRVNLSYNKKKIIISFENIYVHTLDRLEANTAFSSMVSSK